MFPGDLGRYDDPTMLDPAAITEAHYLVVESAYGNRTHERRDPQEALASIINNYWLRVFPTE